MPLVLPLIYTLVGSILLLIAMAIDALTAALCYLFTGGLIWCFVEYIGAVRNSLMARHAKGIRWNRLKIVLATLVTILTWPRYLPVLLQKPLFQIKKGWNLICRGFT
jgi:hypothetical protein